MLNGFLMVFIMISPGFSWGKDDVLKLKLGYVTKVTCEGRLYISAIGNESLVKIEALPKELGCGVILKPTGHTGTTNLLLETSSGSNEREIRVF